MADTNTNILEKCITLGPWGWSMGKEWIYIPKGIIKKIRISHGRYINSIEFQSDCPTQKSYFGGKGHADTQTHTICIDHPDEYLTGISGSIDSHTNTKMLMSLSFHTNQNCYGPYGSDKGKSSCFSYDGKGGVVVGFHGFDFGLIMSIGCYVIPKSLATNWNSTFEQHSRPEKCCRMLKHEIPREVGPWGFNGGKEWDDGVFHCIKQVRVQLGDPSKVLIGIQFKYVKSDSKFILSPFHGRTDDGDISEVEISLDGMQEYLTGISGYYGSEGITSITFHTNKGKHGPYGNEGGDGCIYFTSTPSSGKVVGFHGRSGECLTAIGVHMEYF